MTQKYEMLKDDTIEIGEGYYAIVLHRIRALKSFNDVQKGDLGGYIEQEENLSHDGNCWIYYNAIASGDAEVSEDAQIHGGTVVSGRVKVYGNTCTYGDVQLRGNARVFGTVKLVNGTIVRDESLIYGKSYIKDSVICGESHIKSSDVYSSYINNSHLGGDVVKNENIIDGEYV